MTASARVTLGRMRARPLLLSIVFAAAASTAACEKKPTPAPVAEPSSTGATTSPTESAMPSPTASAPAIRTPMPADMPDLAQRSNAFGVDLYGRIRTNPGNIAISPASISAALAMTYGGAKGETAAQIQKTMHFPGAPATPDATMTSWGNALRALGDPGRPLKLRVANRLFGEKTYTFEPDFLAKTKTAFDAPLEPLDFKTAADPSRIHINQWVEDQTEKRIKDLIPAPAIDGDTRLVLVNAIYFLASWAHPFEKDRTKDAAFHLTKATEKKVPMMEEYEHMPYAKIEGATVIELAYKGNTTAMWVVVPDDVDGLAKVEKGLDAAALSTWRSKLSHSFVHLSLPRFEVNPKESLPLAKELAALGMPLPLTRLKADFTGIANPPNKADQLFLSQVFHKAFVKTDESGTEAAAATAVVMAVGGGAPPKPIDVNADRPFLFFIVDKASSLVLFMGRVADPQGS